MQVIDEKYRQQGDASLGDDQWEGVKFLLSHRWSILSFGTGLGKTLTSLVAIKNILDRTTDVKVLIVCPVKALKAFKREIFTRLKMSKLEVGIVATNEMTLDIHRNRVIIVTDTNIEKYKDMVAEVVAAKNKLVLVVDEAHKLQEKTSKYYKTMKDIRSVCSVVWGLTATPILNDLDSLYNIVDFFHTKFLGRKTDFDNTYTIWHLKDQYIKGGAKIKIKVLDGYKNLDKLNEKLKSIMLVRQKQYNLRFGHVCEELTKQEYDVYEQVSSGILNFEDDERNFSRRLHDLQRFVDRSYFEDESIKELVAQYNS